MLTIRCCSSLFRWRFLGKTSNLFSSSNEKNLFQLVFSSSIGSMANYGDLLKSWAIHGEKPRELIVNSSNISSDRNRRNELKLIGGLIIFRHGARTPLNLLSTIDEVVYKDEHLDNYLPAQWDVKLITKLQNEIVAKEEIVGANELLADRIRVLKSSCGRRVVNGQLTAIGEKQLFQLGNSIRQEFIIKEQIFPSIYDPKIVFCRSTYMDRTISSARAFLAGLFTSEQTKSIESKGPFEIVVHHFPAEDMFPNRNLSPILNQCPKPSTFYENLSNENHLKKARDKLLKRIGIETSPHGIMELNDDIVSRQAHDFPVPEEFLELTKDFEILSAREFVSMATTIDFDLFLRSTIGSLLFSINENLQSIYENSLRFPSGEKSYEKFFIYSGHDTTLIPLAMAFQIFDMRWPNYGDSILIRIFISNENKNEKFVSIDLAGEPQILGNCQSFYCPYSQFVQLIANRLNPVKMR